MPENEMEKVLRRLAHEMLMKVVWDEESTETPMVDTENNFVELWRESGLLRLLEAGQAMRETIEHFHNKLATIGAPPAAETFDAWWGKYIADVDACNTKRGIARDAYAAGKWEGQHGQ